MDGAIFSGFAMVLILLIPMRHYFKLHPCITERHLDALPRAVQSWTLTSLQQRVFKTGGRLVRHARYFILQLAESYLTPRLFRQILGRIERLAWPPT